METCRACSQMNSSISYKVTEPHSCTENMNGLRSYRFVTYNHHMSEPRIEWILESNLQNNNIDLLVGDLIKDYDTLPAKAKARFLVYTMRNKGF